jgi:hypothetical protein
LRSSNRKIWIINYNTWTWKLLVLFGNQHVLTRPYYSGTNIFVTNLHMDVEEKFWLYRCMIWLDKRALEVALKIMQSMTIMLTLHNYVHDGTCIHDLPYLIYRPCSSRVVENCISSLEHTKCPLHILTTTFFFVFQRDTVCSLGIWWLYSRECHPSRIDDIG